MNTILLTIPDLPAEWRDLAETSWAGLWPEKWPELSRWLDQQLVGMSLGQLVEELRILRDAQDKRPADVKNLVEAGPKTLDQILTPEIRRKVLDHGTSALSQAEIQGLFSSPETLLDLQEDIFINGGKFWQTVPRTEAHKQLAQSGFEAIQARIGTEATSVLEPAQNQNSADTPVKPGSWKNAVFAATVLAMSVLVTLAVLNPSREPQMSGTGFGTPGLLDNNVDSQLEYYQRMSVANAEWLKKTRKNSTELLAALRSYGMDCKMVIDSEHPALDDRNERWLKLKCSEWKGRIEEIVVALESEKMSFEDATTKANEVVGNLVKKLHVGPTVQELQQVG
jgi:hypothetical protein